MDQDKVRSEVVARSSGMSADEERRSERKMGLLLMAMGCAIGFVPWLVPGAVFNLGTGMATIFGVLLALVGGLRVSKTFRAPAPSAPEEAPVASTRSSSARDAA